MGTDVQRPVCSQRQANPSIISEQKMQTIQKLRLTDILFSILKIKSQSFG